MRHLFARRTPVLGFYLPTERDDNTHQGFVPLTSRRRTTPPTSPIDQHHRSSTSSIKTHVMPELEPISLEPTPRSAPQPASPLALALATAEAAPLRATPFGPHRPLMHEAIDIGPQLPAAVS
jgi:hypothetical protein